MLHRGAQATVCHANGTRGAPRRTLQQATGGAGAGVRRHARCVACRSSGDGGEGKPAEPQQPQSPEAPASGDVPQQTQQQQQQQQPPRAQEWTTEEMLTRMTPTKRGDAADVTLILVATVALVALSMQLYRAWLLYSMFAEESAFQAAGM